MEDEEFISPLVRPALLIGNAPIVMELFEQRVDLLDVFHTNVRVPTGRDVSIELYGLDDLELYLGLHRNEKTLHGQPVISARLPTGGVH